MKNPPNAKERGLVKGALRRVFSRSELRRQAILNATVNHTDPERPRVTKWVFCSECGEIFPAYLAQVDHVLPIIPVGKVLEDLSWDEIVDHLWCSIDNLSVKDKDCHKEKTREENKERRRLKNEKAKRS